MAGLGHASNVEGVRHRERPVRLTDVDPGLRERQATRMRWYFALMGICLVLILLAWNVVRLYSTTAAVAMSLVAAVLPPNSGGVIVRTVGEDVTQEELTASGIRLTAPLGNVFPSRATPEGPNLRGQQLVFVGHFDDPASSGCVPERVERCRNTFVVTDYDEQVR